ncbi:MAG: baseplate J/gp47 family protein [Candidatus Promineifilaceae bacterium]|nr:baseplate J/gp47 family protein [Candidatus Promineifilaceae bacterium]
MEVIHLAADDDVVSICDRLEWVSGAQRVLLVLPEEADGPLLDEWLDLVRLRRCAERLRLEVGLVTPERSVAAQARALGLPAFPSVRSAERSRRGWWRGRRRHGQPTRPGATVQLGQGRRLKSLPDDADRREMYRRMTPQLGWRRWLWRYLGILLFFITLAIFIVGVAYTVPGATVTLHPEVEVLEAGRQIVADPQLESVNFSGASVPARLLAVTVSWQAQVGTTGTADVPDAPARGTVVFVNLVEQPVIVPAGTRVRTSSGETVVFQTVEPVEVPGVVGSTAEVEVVAIEPGPEGNVGANMVNRVEGSLGLQLEVRNLEPMEGGGVRNVPAVSEADRERLRAQVLQYLQTLAAAEMEELLVEGEFLARDSLRVTDVYQETYSHFVGEPSRRLALEIRAELQGTAVDASQANGLVYEELAAALRPGYELVPGTLNFRAEEVLGVDGQGRVTFRMVAEGRMAASLDIETVVPRVAGQERGIAQAYLYEQLPLRRYPSVRVWPDWFGRLPYLPARIDTELDVGDDRTLIGQTNVGES